MRASTEPDGGSQMTVSVSGFLTTVWLSIQSLVITGISNSASIDTANMQAC